MAVAHSPPTACGPLFRQVVEVLRQEILQGLHPVGHNLPTEQCYRPVSA